MHRFWGWVVIHLQLVRRTAQDEDVAQLDLNEQREIEDVRARLDRVREQLALIDQRKHQRVRVEHPC